MTGLAGLLLQERLFRSQNNIEKYLKDIPVNLELVLYRKKNMFSYMFSFKVLDKKYFWEIINLQIIQPIFLARQVKL